MSTDQTIDVAVGVVYDSTGRVLVNRCQDPTVGWVERSDTHQFSTLRRGQ